jgi:hypothetical protein
MTGFPVEPITVITKTPQLDADGNPVRSGDFNEIQYDVSTLTRDGLFAPAIGYESTGGQDQVVSQPHVYFTGQDAADVRAVISSTSELARGGQTGYQVDGEVADWGDAGLDVPLKRTAG